MWCSQANTVCSYVIVVWFVARDAEPSIILSPSLLDDPFGVVENSTLIVSFACTLPRSSAVRVLFVEPQIVMGRDGLLFDRETGQSHLPLMGVSDVVLEQFTMAAKCESSTRGGHGVRRFVFEFVCGVVRFFVGVVDGMGNEE